MERKQWLATRKTGIGGSDAAAILGLSPWKSPMDVWMDKKGMVPERVDPDKEFLMDLGERLEPVIAGLYTRETGREIVIPAQKIFRHRVHPVLLATPDRIGADVFWHDTTSPRPMAFGVELKTENVFSNQFGDPGTDQVPQHYLIQCAHYMNVLDFPRWDLAVLHGGVKFSIYTIERSRELDALMTNQLVEWWAKHILRGVPPEMDGSDGWRQYLHEKYPSQLLPIEKINPDDRELLARYAQIRHAETLVAKLRTETENQLKALIGDREGVYGQGGRVTWKKTKDGHSVDWEALALLMQRKYGTAPEMFTQLKNSVTTVKPGVRRFLFTPEKEKHGNDSIGNAAPAALDLPRDGERGTGGAGEGPSGSPVRDGGAPSA